MDITSLSFDEFRPLRITLLDVGPFRNQPYVLDFFGRDPAMKGDPDNYVSLANRAPSNLFLLLAANGFGKTTVLETIEYLMRLLDRRPQQPVRALDDLARGSGVVQLDIRTVITINGVRKSVLLSLWAGSESMPFPWTKSDVETLADVSEQASIGFYRKGPISELEPAGTDAVGRMILDAVTAATGTPPPGLFGEGCSLPTVLYFPADRRLIRPLDTRAIVRPDHWGYQPAHRFDIDGSQWENSLENLLVWLTWIGDGREETLRNMADRYVFQDGTKTLMEVDREELTVNVKVGDAIHRLERLSHGERQLLQFWLRTFAHMTTNTIVLIDEMEIHLHHRWQIGALQMLKQLIVDFPNITVIMSSHERDIIKHFGHTRPEAGIIKGGHIIEKDIGE